MSTRRLIRTNCYSKEQIRLLLDNTPLHDRVGIVLATHAGLSPDELVQLSAKCFDLRNGWIFVPAIHAEHPRYIRIAPMVGNFIAPFLRHGNEATYALSQIDGTQLSLSSLQHSLELALQKAGLQTCTVDELRWTGGAWLLDVGLSYAAVAGRFGVTRETLYRHFPRQSDVKRSHLSLEEAIAAIALC